MSAVATPPLEWVAGRRELFSQLPPSVPRFDPRERAAAPFFARLRQLDQRAWAAPLGRVRPSWVFYDCALMPGALFGYADRDAATVHPRSLVAFIPTLDGSQLVQSLACDDDALATRTLRDGMARLASPRIVAAMPWNHPFLKRFLSIGPLRVLTAWTPAHDEPRTLTFAVTTLDPPLHAPGDLLDIGDAAALRALQVEVESGRPIFVTSVGAGRAQLARPR